MNLSSSNRTIYCNDSTDCNNTTNTSMFKQSTMNIKLEVATGFYRAYFSPVIAILGIAGNIIVIITFLSENQKSRFSIYCIALAIVHSIILIMNSILDDFFGRGLHYATNGAFMIKIDTYTVGSCRFMEYIPNVMYFASSFLLLAFTIDRILTIYHPLKFYSIFYKLYAVGLCCAIIVGSFAIMGTFPAIYVLQKDKHAVDKFKCKAADNIFMSMYSLRMKIFGSFVIPTLLILLANFAICAKLWHITHTRQKLMPNDQKRNSLEMNRVVGHLALSTTFLFFTMPLVVVMILRQYSDHNELEHSHPEYATSLEHLSRLFASIKDITYAVDFYLYLVFLRNFRWRLLHMLCKPCLGRDWFIKSSFGSEINRRVQKCDMNSRRRFSTISALCQRSIHNHRAFCVNQHLVLKHVQQDHTGDKNEATSL